MPNLKAMNLKDLQMHMALLQTFEGEGITDIRFIRQMLDEHLRKEAMEVARVIDRKSKVRLINGNLPYIKCPDCPGTMSLKLREGVTYYGCSRCYKSIEVI